MCSVEIQIQNIDSIAHDLGQLHLCDGGHRIFFFLQWNEKRRGIWARLQTCRQCRVVLALEDKFPSRKESLERTIWTACGCADCEQ